MVRNTLESARRISWPALALLAGLTFVLVYLVLPFSLAAAGASSGVLTFVRGFAGLATFVLATLAFYRLLRTRAALAWAEAQPIDEAPVPPLAQPARRGEPVSGPNPGVALGEWTVARLQALDFTHLQRLCLGYYAHKGFRAEAVPLGPAGGTEIRLWRDTIEGDPRPYALVRSHAWSEPADEDEIREFLRVMAHERISRAFFVAPRGFTEAARSFAQGYPLTLLDGRLLLAMLERLPASPRQALLDASLHP